MLFPSPALFFLIDVVQLSNYANNQRRFAPRGGQHPRTEWTTSPDYAPKAENGKHGAFHLIKREVFGYDRIFQVKLPRFRPPFEQTALSGTVNKTSFTGKPEFVSRSCPKQLGRKRL